LSGSISEFWRKWHISLSSWLRDYLYIPLGGSKKGVVRTYVNLIIVMFLGGLWHGAAWSFAVWGLWHGIGLAIERPWLDSRFMTSTNPLLRGIRIFLVFNFVSIGWLFFKLQDFSQALSYIGTMIKSDANSVALRDISLIGIYSSAVLFYHLISTYKSKMPRFLNDAIYGAMLFLILTNPGPSKPFIYFQF
jgi:alginate O-acetyltransferase complex protein AlgI